MAPLDADFLSPDDVYFTYYLAGTLMCLIISGLAAGMTVAFLSLDPLKMQIIARTGTDLERDMVNDILPILANHHRNLATLLVTNTIANETLPIFLDYLIPSWLSVTLSVTCVFMFCEVMPSSLFTGPQRLALTHKSLPLMKFFLWLMYPIAMPLGKPRLYIYRVHFLQLIYCDNELSFMNQSIFLTFF